MVDLIPMTKQEYQTYISALIPNFAVELEKTGDFTCEEALKKTRQMVKELLPRGIETPNHFLFDVMAEGESQPIGILYIALQEEGNAKNVFIYDIEIKERYRGRGYRILVMRQAEKFARSRKAAQIWLHVFASNTIAFQLYQKLGYEVRKEFFGKNGELISCRMAKNLIV